MTEDSYCVHGKCIVPAKLFVDAVKRKKAKQGTSFRGSRAQRVSLGLSRWITLCDGDIEHSN